MAKKDIKDKAYESKNTSKADEVKEEIKDEVKDQKESVEEKEEAKDTEEKKKTDIETEEDPRDAQIADLKDRLLRNQAEFENFRKRNEKEKADMFGAGSMNVLEKIIPVIDNFERGLDASDDSPFAEGIKMIYKQLMSSLEEMGVKEIDALGKTFDPNFHNAVMHEDSEEAGEQEITQVLQKGYLYHDQVLRFAMVKVAN